MRSVRKKERRKVEQGEELEGRKDEGRRRSLLNLSFPFALPSRSASPCSLAQSGSPHSALRAAERLAVDNREDGCDEL